MERIKFERVVPTDQNRFRPLVEAYWLEIMPHADTVCTSDDRDSYFAERFPLSNTEPRIFWGLSEGSPVGFISFAISGTSAKINDFYVVSSKRRRGIGTFLVKSAIEITDSMGVDRIDLNVRRDNPASLKFWEAQGFMIGHYELIQYRDPEKRIGFRGALSSDFV
ncbi:MAG: GNAT family N-acetyltransferase [Gemmatimonadetes bacterium]|nr:GNAT family N-acetyltransferase [Gemmatimonadota bacterium]MYI63544.1 GNAT family N-acetyltransferase [Gemmatimonadota bacterium]